MDVILDTNIYRQDLSLKSARFDVLLDYVQRTSSRVLLPALVRDELEGHLRREVYERLDRIARAQEDIARLLPHRSHAASAIALDVQVETQAYMSSLAKRIGADPRVLDYQDRHLREVVARAINRQRPCSAEGEEIRDAILWLTVLEAAQEATNHEMIFISNNTKQFADSKSALHGDLAEECRTRKVTVKYFASLDEFVRQHAVNVAFATPEWLMREVDTDKVFERAYDEIVGIAENRFEDIRDGDEEFGGDVELADGSLSDPDVYVYEMADGSYRIEATYFGVLQFNFAVSRPADFYHSHNSWRDYGYHSRDRERGWRTVEVETTVRLEGTARDQKILTWAVAQVERG